MVFGRLTCAEPIRVSISSFCYPPSIKDSIFGFRDSSVCPLNGIDSFDVAAVIEVFIYFSISIYIHTHIYTYTWL